MTLILHGGDGSFLGAPIDVLGHRAAERLLDADARRRREDGGCATSSTTRGSRSPTRATRSARPRTRSSSSARPSADAPGCSRPRCRPTRSRLTITFLALLARRRVARRRARRERDRPAARAGSVGLGQLVWSKVALAAAVALAARPGDLRSRSGSSIEIGGVAGGEPWQRLPLLVVGLVLAGAALGALGALLGALAREARSGLARRAPGRDADRLPRPDPARGRARRPPGSATRFPFAHAVRFFQRGALRPEPWASVLRERALAGRARAWSSAGSPGSGARRLLTMSSFPSRGCAGCAAATACARSCARRGSTSTTSSAALRRPATEPNAELPALGRFSVDDLRHRGRGGSDGSACSARDPVRDPDEKDAEGSGAWDDDGVVQRALRALRDALPGSCC